jgi:hypothetical protein
VNTGHGHVRNLLESAARPGEADETVKVRGHTSYGDITIHRSRLLPALEKKGNHDHQPIPAGGRRGRATTAGQRRRAHRRRRHRK